MTKETLAEEMMKEGTIKHKGKWFSLVSLNLSGGNSYGARIEVQGKEVFGLARTPLSAVMDALKSI